MFKSVECLPSKSNSRNSDSNVRIMLFIVQTPVVNVSTELKTETKKTYPSSVSLITSHISIFAAQSSDGKFPSVAFSEKNERCDEQVLGQESNVKHAILSQTPFKKTFFSQPHTLLGYI